MSPSDEAMINELLRELELSESFGSEVEFRKRSDSNVASLNEMAKRSHDVESLLHLEQELDSSLAPYQADIEK